MNSLLQAIGNVGKDKIVFLAPFRPLRRMLIISYTSSSDPEVMLPARIAEDVYKLADNYKITLEPMYEGYARDHYYISDLESLIRKGTVKVMTELHLNA